MYEMLYRMERTGIDIKYWTNRGQYTPPHWHGAIELLYILNGEGAVTCDGKEYLVQAGQFIVIDSDKIHEMKCAKVSMMLIIHFSRKRMENYVHDLGQFELFSCEEIYEKKDEKKYQEICQMLRSLVPLYVREPVGYLLKGQAIAMEILFELLNHFSRKKEKIKNGKDEETLKRLKEITDYIEQHYKNTITLEEISSSFFLSREYFSRFFKKNMGVAFSRYVNQIRLMHIYYDICNSDEGIMKLAEKHGFRNYKMFNKMFHETYGCTPSQARKQKLSMYIQSNQWNE